MHTRANTEIIIYSGKGRGQVVRDLHYNNDKQKNCQKQSPSPNSKSDIARYKRAGRNRKQEQS